MADGVRAQQRERTRSELQRVGRRLFSEQGYAAVGLAEVVRTAGVTKGALYHHFPGGKTDLFRAVLADVQQEVADAVAAAADGEPDPWARLTTGCRAFLTASTEPAARRVMLVDGPAVLGWSEWRAMDETGAGRHLGEALAELVDAGVLAPQPVAPLAHLLSGAMNEAALWVAGTDDPQDLADALAALTRLLDALRVG
ncbi:TetR/AcrR family transcriptional regulator [Pseudonocardia humida]|uniref:TetR/AcrR family transcriptional regulator n=1 Tax=Pseudonocardia humida TaxID=2800819 RepID=A0ABT1ACW5_9PSEU|nr:TetR/AcrR family transcriptional regulator [Pseudonocardia humida]MCO1660741.1 TetR/AcrR family transcriptional regulator [Pseudonocardia humida]